MKIIIKNDEIFAKEKSKKVRTDSIRNISRVIQVTTGEAVFANDQDFHIFEIRNEFWVPQAIYIENDLNDIEGWCSNQKIRYETKHLDYPPKAFWKKRFLIKYAVVSPGIYSKKSVTEI